MTRFALCAALAVLVLSAAPRGAQGQPRFQRAPDGPLTRLSLDARTGVFTSGPALESRAFTDTVEFSNVDLGGFVGVDTGAGCEWFDAGLKGAGNHSDLMNQFTFAYCPSGPTGTLTLEFYEGYTAGGASPGTSVAQFTLTGLPGSTLGGGCYFTSVNLDPLVCFADGPIGYSWKFDAVDPVYPFLACVQSCSGPGPDGQGMIDQLDRRCLPSPAFVPFTIPGFVSSIALEIREVVDAPATSALFFGDGLNADTLNAPPIVVGSPWPVSVGIGHSHGAGGVLALRVRTGTVNGPNVNSPVGGRLTEPLIQGPLLAAVSGSHNGSSGAFPVLNVPKSPSLLSLPWAAQATVLGGGFADLSQAAAGVVGTE